MTLTRATIAALVALLAARPPSLSAQGSLGATRQ